MKSGMFLIVMLAFAVVPGWADVPKPLEVPVSWLLDFDFQPLQAIRVEIPGEKQPRVFWYLRYAVTNHTSEEPMFVPDFILYTDTGQMIPAGQKVPAAVFQEIKKQYNDPFSKDLSAMAGKILQGADNAKRGIAIWPDFDPAAGAIDLFVGGLSGETVQIHLPKPITVKEIDPDGKEKQVQKSTIVLSRTLHLRYSIPGEAAGRLKAPVKLVEKDWVMR